MRPLLGNAAVVHDHDPVRQAKGRLAVCDQQHGLGSEGVTQGVVDRLLRAGVDGARRIVQDEDARVGEDRARDRDALTLSAGQAEPTLADHGVVSPGQGTHELIR